MNWIPGETKLVCIEAFTNLSNMLYTNGSIKSNAPHKEKLPAVGEVVTYNGDCPDFKASILLVEYVVGTMGQELSFVRHKFRPLDEVLESISITELIEEPQPA